MKPKDRTKKQWIRFISIVIGFVILISVLYIRLLSVRQKNYLQEVKAIPLPVEVMKTAPVEVWLESYVLGKVEGDKEISIVSEVKGKVTQIHVEVGDQIEKGNPIISLKDKRIEYTLSEATASLEAAKAELKEVERQYNLYKALYSKGVVSKDNFESLSNKLKVKKAEIKAREAIYQQAKLDYENLTLRAPIKGVITKILPDEGQQVLVNEEVARMVNPNSKKITAGVDASIVKKLKRGTTVRILPEEETSSLEGRGVITGIGINTDPPSGIYPIEIKIIEGINYWIPGEFVRVIIPIKKFTNVIKVPISSVYTMDGQSVVFVVNNGIAKKVPIKFERLNKDYVLIPYSFLPKGSKIIVEGGGALKGGEKVKIIRER